MHKWLLVTWRAAYVQGVPKKGEDPERDAREKALSRLATRWAAQTPSPAC